MRPSFGGLLAVDNQTAGVNSGKNSRPKLGPRGCPRIAQHVVPNPPVPLQDVDVPVGSLIAAFGKGKFVARSCADEVEHKSEVLFALNSADDMVLFNNNLMTVGQVVNKKHETDPQATVSYHNISEVPDGPFKLENTHYVAFSPASAQTAPDSGDGGTSLAQASGAAIVEPRMWQMENKAVGIIWSVQWKARGLTPVRPQVVVLRAVNLPAGRAFVIR